MHKSRVWFHFYTAQMLCHKSQLLAVIYSDCDVTGAVSRERQRLHEDIGGMADGSISATFTQLFFPTNVGNAPVGRIIGLEQQTYVAVQIEGLVGVITVH